MPTGETRKMPEEYKWSKDLVFTAAQEARIREIVDEQLAKYEKRKLHEARFGVAYPPKEAK